MTQFYIWIVSTIIVTIMSGIFIVKYLKKVENADLTIVVIEPKSLDFPGFLKDLFDENSISMGVTVLDVSGCRVVQIKSNEKDGYSAAQLTIGSAKNVAKPLAEHYKKYNVEPGEGLFEVPFDEESPLESGKHNRIFKRKRLLRCYEKT